MQATTCEEYVLAELEYYKARCEELEEELEASRVSSSGISKTFTVKLSELRKLGIVGDDDE